MTTSFGKYKTYSNKKDFGEAREFCRLKGGHLVVFETEAEYNAFGTFPEHYWVGAANIGGKKIFEDH